MSWISAVLLFSILAVIVVLANFAEKRPALRPPLYISLLAINGLFVANFLFLTLSNETGGDILPVAAITLLFGGAAFAALFESVRRRLARLFPRPQLTGTGFEPESMVHMTALLFCIYFLGTTILQYAMAGGLSGLAEDFSAPSAGAELLQLGLFIVFPLLGVGLGIR